MNLKGFLWGALCLLAMGQTFVSCDDNEDVLDDTGSKVELPGRRAYILYEGSFGASNSGLAFYAPDGNADFVSDIYLLQNGKGMGDTGLSMLEHNDYIYVVVSGSNCVVRLNAAGVEQNRSRTFENTPRHIAAEDGFVYVTQYGGRVSKLDGVTLEEIDAYQEGDGCLEGIAECDGRLYVANSYRYDESGNIVYNKEVWVINANTMELERKITDVTVNPERLWECEDRIYLISRGDYGTVKNELQVINPYADNQVTPLGEVTKLAEGGNGLLYLVNTTTVYDSDWNATTTNSYFTYNTTAGTMNDHSFLNEAPEELFNSTVYMVEVDDETGDIYIGTSDYVNEGKVYRFDRNGTLKDSFNAGGINPNSMLFID